MSEAVPCSSPDPVWHPPFNDHVYITFTTMGIQGLIGPGQRNLNGACLQVSRFIKLVQRLNCLAVATEVSRILVLYHHALSVYSDAIINEMQDE